MSDTHELTTNFRGWVRGASAQNIIALLDVLTEELLARNWPGAFDTQRAVEAIRRQVHRDPLGNPIPLTFRPQDVRHE